LPRRGTVATGRRQRNFGVVALVTIDGVAHPDGGDCRVPVTESERRCVRSSLVPRAAAAKALGEKKINGEKLGLLRTYVLGRRAFYSFRYQLSFPEVRLLQRVVFCHVIYKHMHTQR
jgi:hypothetical protein